MLLGFDIGNTNTTLGIYENSVVPEKNFRYRTEKKITSDELGLLIKNFLNIYSDQNRNPLAVTGLAFSSVVPEINKSYVNMAKSFFDVDIYEINHMSKLHITIGYTNPEQIGVDRIVNAEAAYREYGEGSIIIDIGTAATFCVLLENGTLDGGLIAPGIGTTIESLASLTSKLPRIDFEKPDRLVAKDTINAIKSGFFYGWISLIDGLINKIQKEYNKNFKIILTGGYSKIISSHLENKNVVDFYLTMKGIKYIYDFNR